MLFDFLFRRYCYLFSILPDPNGAVIARHGTPAFLKIDVEGFEAQVLAGLTVPVPLIAFEFLPGLPAATRDCLNLLPDRQFNVVRGEANAFLWPDWRSRADLEAWLATQAPGDPSGDIYARASPATIPGSAAKS